MSVPGALYISGPLSAAVYSDDDVKWLSQSCRSSCICSVQKSLGTVVKVDPHGQCRESGGPGVLKSPQCTEAAQSGAGGESQLLKSFSAPIVLLSVKSVLPVPWARGWGAGTVSSKDRARIERPPPSALGLLLRHSCRKNMYKLRVRVWMCREKCSENWGWRMGDLFMYLQSALLSQGVGALGTFQTTL